MVHIHRIKPPQLLNINMWAISVPKNITNLVVNLLKRSNLKIANISKTRKKQKNKGIFLVRSVNLEQPCGGASLGKLVYKTKRLSRQVRGPGGNMKNEALTLVAQTWRSLLAITKELSTSPSGMVNYNTMNQGK
jgi:hypothetical protein